VSATLFASAENVLKILAAIYVSEARWETFEEPDERTATERVATVRDKWISMVYVAGLCCVLRAAYCALA
jgi:hypothetical protein